VALADLANAESVLLWFFNRHTMLVQHLMWLCKPQIGIIMTLLIIRRTR